MDPKFQIVNFIVHTTDIERQAVLKEIQRMGHKIVTKFAETHTCAIKEGRPCFVRIYWVEIEKPEGERLEVAFYQGATANADPELLDTWVDKVFLHLKPEQMLKHGAGLSVTDFLFHPELRS